MLNQNTPTFTNLAATYPLSMKQTVSNPQVGKVRSKMRDGTEAALTDGCDKAGRPSCHPLELALAADLQVPPFIQPISARAAPSRALMGPVRPRVDGPSEAYAGIQEPYQEMALKSFLKLQKIFRYVEKRKRLYFEDNTNHKLCAKFHIIFTLCLGDISDILTRFK